MIPQKLTDQIYLLDSQIPPTSVTGHYKLKVEGLYDGVQGGVAFVNETNLIFSNRSMTIFIQTDKPIYKQGDQGRVFCDFFYMYIAVRPFCFLPVLLYGIPWVQYFAILNSRILICVPCVRSLISVYFYSQF